MQYRCTVCDDTLKERAPGVLACPTCAPAGKAKYTANIRVLITPQTHAALMRKVGPEGKVSAHVRHLIENDVGIR